MVNGINPIQPLQVGAAISRGLESTSQDAKSQAQLTCEAQGGRWDLLGQICILPQDKKQAPARQPTQPAPPGSVAVDAETDRPAGFINSRGDFVKASKADIAKQLEPGAKTTERVGLEQSQLREGQELSQQVGVFDEVPITSNTGLDEKEALTTGVRDSIPGALRLGASLGVGAAALGAVATAPIGGVGAVPAAAIGASVGFVAGIVGGMISNFKQQRKDTTTAQQRVLDEGKQTMKDWATLARADPSNKNFYLGEYNKVSSQINQAYRQMQFDKIKDVTKLETALPNLAEFESFYASGGERDSLDLEMISSLQAPLPENYNMLELSHRRGAIK